MKTGFITVTRKVMWGPCSSVSSILTELSFQSYSVLDWKENVRRKLAFGSSILKPHNAFITQNFLMIIKWPPYSPNIGACVLNTLRIKGLLRYFFSCKIRWEQCTHSQGNYFKGDGVNTQLYNIILMVYTWNVWVAHNNICKLNNLELFISWCALVILREDILKSR